MSNPRYSIIPAGAVTDPRIEPRDLQVLCLLGRHIDDLGWCRRSQVKMAKELGCARSTVQGSLDRLIDAGWVEKRPEPRGPQGDTAHSYRVRLDHNETDMFYRDAANLGTGRKRGKSEGQSENPAEGAAPPPPADLSAPPVPPQERHPVPIYASAPVTSPVERSLRENARAREEGKPLGLKPVDDPETEARWQRLVAAYPPGALGNLARAKPLFLDLGEADQTESADAVPRVLHGWKAEGRSHKLSLETYLGNRDWTRFPQPRSAPTAEPAVELNAFSKELWAMFWQAVLEAVAGKGSADRVRNRLQWLPKGLTTQAMTLPTQADLDALVPVEIGSMRHDVWLDWAERVGVRLPRPDVAKVIFVPAEEPPELWLAWKGYHLALPVTIPIRGPAWWWRLYSERASVADLIRDRSHGNLTLTMGPLPLRREVEAMVEVDPGHPAWFHWEMWFRARGAHLLALHGSIWAPTEYPPTAEREKREEAVA